MTAPSKEQIEQTVRDRYGRAAQIVLTEQGTASCCGDAAPVSISAIGDYDPNETAALPQAAVLASLGCGNPTALADLRPGETVLDLGSGGGIDVLLSAKRVGPDGHAYGLDMTDEMLELAERNRAEAGVENVTFLKGQIEDIPLPDNSVDVIISNCVINLSADKDQVLREAHRVLKPGGRFAVSDIVFQGDVPDAIRQDMESWAGCVAGALEENEYLTKLSAAGFQRPGIEVTSVHDVAGSSCCADPAEVSDSACCAGPVTGAGARTVSAFIRAQKPF